MKDLVLLDNLIYDTYLIWIGDTDLIWLFMILYVFFINITFFIPISTPNKIYPKNWLFQMNSHLFSMLFNNVEWNLEKSVVWHNSSFMQSNGACSIPGEQSSSNSDGREAQRKVNLRKRNAECNIEKINSKEWKIPLNYHLNSAFISASMN